MHEVELDLLLAQHDGGALHPGAGLEADQLIFRHRGPRVNSGGGTMVACPDAAIKGLSPAAPAGRAPPPEFALRSHPPPQPAPARGAGASASATSTPAPSTGAGRGGGGPQGSIVEM